MRTDDPPMLPKCVLSCFEPEKRRVMSSLQPQHGLNLDLSVRRPSEGSARTGRRSGAAESPRGGGDSAAALVDPHTATTPHTLL